MSPELDAQLCAKYPKIFAQRNGSIQETCMAWGCEVGNGWFNILDQLCSHIQWHIDGVEKQRLADVKFNETKRQAELGNWTLFLEDYKWCNTEKDLARWKEQILTAQYRTVTESIPQVEATQVKEKFGTLRFYHSGGDNTIDGMVYLAEGMSGVTCEECGAPGQMNTSGWLSVRCKEHTK